MSPLDSSTAASSSTKTDVDHEIEHEIHVLESDMNMRIAQTHKYILETIAQKAGIDMRPIYQETLRRNRIQRQMLSQGYEKIRQKSVPYAQQEAIRNETALQEYLEKHHGTDSVAPASKAASGCYLVWRAMSDHPEVETSRDSLPGMVGWGCRDPIMAQHRFETSATLCTEYEWPYHVFKPYVYVSTGEDDHDVFQEIEYSVLMQGRAPRSTFHIESVQVWLSGRGFLEKREGHVEFGHPGVLGGLTDARVEVVVQLWRGEPDRFIQLLRVPNFWVAPSPGWSVSAPVTFGGRVFDISHPIPVFAGQEFGVRLMLRCRASAWEVDSSSEVDFHTHASYGLNLMDVRLCGS